MTAGHPMGIGGLRRLLCRLGFHKWAAWEWGVLGVNCKRCGREIDRP